MLLSRLYVSSMRNSEQKHVKEFARTRVGVDVSGWLHRGIYTCASKLCRGIDTRQYVDYCMHRVRLLIHFGATPVIVFDGAALPMKADTHAERRERRADALVKAEEAFAKGNSRVAEEWYQKACPVTPQMARHVIRELRRLNVEYVVAPYEADAQLAWMMRTGYVESVITEDSDLLVYGASKVLYKMTKTGEGDLYQMKNLPALDTISMLNFSEEMFLYMCVCAGCDFFKGVKGLGLRTSHTMVKKYRTMSRLTTAIRHDPRYPVSKTFTADFARACLVFRHQTVYDIGGVKTVSLQELDAVAKAKLPPGVLVEAEDGTLDLSFLGAHRDPMIAKNVAQGYFHPGSLKEYDEPLDVIERPVGRKRRPNYEPAKRIRSTQTREAMDIRGFQVQPANASSSRNAFSMAANLRQRLSSGSRTFNPRRVAAGFKASNGSSKTQNPKFGAASSSGIWASFRKPRLPAPVTSQSNCDEKVEDEDEEPEMFPELNTPENESSDGSEQEKESSPRRLDKRPRSANLEEVKVEATDVCSPSSKRVDALNRALARFASQPKDQKSLKFVADSIPAPPSPDRDAYELFEQIDADLSREAEDVTDKCAASRDVDVPIKRTPDAGAAKQVRLSRFFPTRNQSGDATNGGKDKQIRTKAKSSSTTDRLALRKSIAKTVSLKGIERFKRGASGKRISANKLLAKHRKKR